MLVPILAMYFINMVTLYYFILSTVLTSYYIYLCYNLRETKTPKKSNLLAKKDIYVFYNVFIFSFLISAYR